MLSIEQTILSELQAAQIKYTPEQVADLALLYTQLRDFNKSVNVTAITKPREVAKKHFADSLLPLRTDIFFKGAKCLDVGTGAGFPGLPLSIFLPECDFLLMDSLAKKLSFTDSIIKILKLKNAKTVVYRAEEMVRKEEGVRESFDIVFSRAVSNLATLAELCLPYLKVGGYFLSYKSRNVKKEVEEADFALKVLGGEVCEIFGSEERNLVIVRKFEETPPHYPRRVGIPEKRPIMDK